MTFTSALNISVVRYVTDSKFARLTHCDRNLAMKGDREKCIEAGASDYISKPVDIDQLLSLLRVWLYDTGK
jgi:hypothetical protein